MSFDNHATASLQFFGSFSFLLWLAHELTVQRTTILYQPYIIWNETFELYSYFGYFKVCFYTNSIFMTKIKFLTVIIQDYR